MYYNPYKKEYYQVSSQIENLKKETEELKCRIERYYKTSLDKLREKKTLLEERISEAKKGIPETFWDTFIPIIGLVKAIKRYKVSKEVLDLTKNLKDLESKIQELESTDIDVEESRYNSLIAEKNNLKIKLRSIEKKKVNIDKIIGSSLKILKQKEGERNILEKEIEELQILDRKLNIADNGYQRAMIHRDCESRFGGGKPYKLMRKKRRHSAALEREINKLEKKIQNQVRRATRKINTLIIDGNNFCYEGDKFRGLKPLKSVLPELSDAYDIIIIFDSDIRGLTSKNDKNIRMELSGNYKIHVVASGQKADETIINLVSDDDTSFVLSNDRFAEYTPDYPELSKKLIRHEIIGRKILINSLGVKTTY